MQSRAKCSSYGILTPVQIHVEKEGQKNNFSLDSAFISEIFLQNLFWKMQFQVEGHSCDFSIGYSTFCMLCLSTLLCLAIESLTRSH